MGSYILVIKSANMKLIIAFLVAVTFLSVVDAREPNNPDNESSADTFGELIKGVGRCGNCKTDDDCDCGPCGRIGRCQTSFIKGSWDMGCNCRTNSDCSSGCGSYHRCNSIGRCAN